MEVKQQNNRLSDEKKEEVSSKAATPHTKNLHTSKNCKIAEASSHVSSKHKIEKISETNNEKEKDKDCE